MGSKIENKKHSISIVIQLLRHVSNRRRYQFVMFFILTIISSFAEVVSLGAVVPFIGILTQPEAVFNYPIMQGPIEFLNISTPVELVLPLTIGFAMAALFAGGLRLILLWVGIRLTNATGADISIEIFRRTLYQPYSIHVSRSSSEIISGITQKVSTAIKVLLSLVTVTTSAVLFTAILGTLLVIDPVVATVAIFSFGIGYVLIALLARRRLLQNSAHEAREQTQVVKSLQEGLGAIRDVLLDGTQNVYCAVYRKAILMLQRVNADSAFINQAPRYAMESIGMVMIAGLAFILSKQVGGIAAALPILGALALGAQRLLPLLQQLYGNWVNIAASYTSLQQVLLLLEQPLPQYLNNATPDVLEYNDAIIFDKVRFRYNSDGPWVLDNISLTIKKGCRIGFIGSTGCGKSTMLDLLMSLLAPSSGDILLDGKRLDNTLIRAWQRNIAHVPQNIFLSDCSIAENIAFGVPKEKINMEQVKRAAEKAQIAEFINMNPDGYMAVVGERGVRLSGGQRQRIGIARALYKQARVLVFDEATSALDSNTEQAVMSAIENLDRDLTIIIIAHRMTTLKKCDTIVQLEHGKITAQDTYDYFINKETSYLKNNVS